MMKCINYNVTGELRKALVRAISNILGEDAIYQGAPTFAYKVEGYAISRNGEVTCPDTATREEVNQLTASLRDLGFIAADAIPDSTGGLIPCVVEMPREGFSEEAYGNLQKIIASKATLLKKALGTDSLEVKTSEEKLIFPWFTLHGLDGEADAYTRLVSALYNMAKNQKRVTARERNNENDKFTMRIFLIRLGFIGDEYKTARRILLQNLTGNGSWKSGHAPERTANIVAEAEPAANAEGGAPYAK